MSVLGRRIRGFRLIDLMAFLVLVALILGVYLAKTIAGRERAQIASAERGIAAEKAEIRVLKAEVAHLEEPARIQKLSETYLGMVPLPIKREVDPDALAEVALHPAVAKPAAQPPAEAQR